jgi:hypothetical protein
MVLAPHAFNVRGDLVQMSILASVGVAINTELNLYICLPCGSVHVHSKDDNSGILMHLRREPHNGADAAARDHILERTHGLKIIEEYPKIVLQMEPRPAFSGVFITQDQHGCMHCPYVAGKKRVQ